MATILADDIFKCIFLNENDRISIQISLKFVPRGPVDNKWALVHVMAWHRIGDKPLSESKLTRFTSYFLKQCWPSAQTQISALEGDELFKDPFFCSVIPHSTALPRRSFQPPTRMTPLCNAPWPYNERSARFPCWWRRKWKVLSSIGCNMPCCMNAGD